MTIYMYVWIWDNIIEMVLYINMVQKGVAYHRRPIFLYFTVATTPQQEYVRKV